MTAEEQLIQDILIAYEGRVCEQDRLDRLKHHGLIQEDYVKNALYDRGTLYLDVVVVPIISLDHIMVSIKVRNE